MLVNHERRLLRRAAEAANLQISITKNANRTWPSDHSRLVALETRGAVRLVGAPVAAEHCAESVTWQITDHGLTVLHTLSC